MSVAIITGADARFFDLMRGCIRSLRSHAAHGDVFLGVLDSGLNAEQQAWLADQDIPMAAADWDIPIPAGRDLSRLIQLDFARPFLPRYFPGHDIYLWVDADAWVQDWAAVDLFVRGAKRSGCAIVPEVHPAYRNFREKLEIDYFLGLPRRVAAPQYKRYKRAYGQAAADAYGTLPVLNAGVCAIHKDAPHWERWQTNYAAGVQQTDRRLNQGSLNYSIYHDDLPVDFLPARCNWLCHMGAPAFDPERNLYVEPTLPHETIGIMHLAAGSKDGPQEIPLIGGGTDRRELRFPGGGDGA